MLLVVVLSFAVTVCAIALLASRISIMALLRFMDEKGYDFPTEAESKECCRKTIEQMFRHPSSEKGMR